MAKRIIGKNNKSKQKKKKSLPIKWILGFLFGILFLFSIYHYRQIILYHLGYNSVTFVQTDKMAQARIYEILSAYEDKTLGFDVSQYQGNINWQEIDSLKNFKLNFVFIRATVGNEKVDTKFKTNWKNAKNYKFIRGAYHYYRPNENSIEQAKIFVKNVTLQKGDLPPVLDIEKLPQTQSMNSLKLGLKRWLNYVENYYGVKPIIYTGERYYNEFLKEEFFQYNFWVANYNPWVETIKDDWLFWQFSEKAVIKGINHKVDVNIYNGTPKMLQYLTITN